MEFEWRDIRKLIYFFWKRELSAANIAKEINSKLGMETTNEHTCRRWVAQFKDDIFDAADKEHEDIQNRLDSNKY